MRRSTFLPPLLISGCGLFGLLSLSAWFHVQSVRLSYRSQTIRQELDQLERREQGNRRGLEAALSLSRLDACARGRRGLALPRPDQIRIFVETP